MEVIIGCQLLEVMSESGDSIVHNLKHGEDQLLELGTSFIKLEKQIGIKLNLALSVINVVRTRTSLHIVAKLSAGH